MVSFFRCCMGLFFISSSWNNELCCSLVILSIKNSIASLIFSFDFAEPMNHLTESCHGKKGVVDDSIPIEIHFERSFLQIRANTKALVNVNKGIHLECTS